MLYRISGKIFRKLAWRHFKNNRFIRHETRRKESSRVSAIRANEACKSRLALNAAAGSRDKDPGSRTRKGPARSPGRSLFLKSRSAAQNKRARPFLFLRLRYRGSGSTMLLQQQQQRRRQRRARASASVRAATFLQRAPNIVEWNDCAALFIARDRAIWPARPTGHELRTFVLPSFSFCRSSRVCSLGGLLW